MHPAAQGDRPFVAKLLRRKEHEGTLILLRTARDWGQRPLTLLVGADGRKWTQRDIVLAAALTLHEQSICPGCGHYKDESYNPDSEGYYEVHDLVCNACGAIDLHRRDASRKDDAPGTKPVVLNTRPPHVPLRPWTPPGVSVASH